MALKRIFVLLLSALAGAVAARAAGGPPVHAIDHIGVGCADLDKGIAAIAGKTGVHAVKGGRHPGRGTQNALMSLGGGTYLEIIAPVAGARLEGDDAALLKLVDPKPVFWAIRSSDLDATARLLKEKGYAATAIRPGSRQLPDGSTLRWRAFALTGLDAAPFFIEWDKASPHPSTTSPGGCTLKRLQVLDKDPAALTKLFSVLGLDLAVGAAPAPALRVTLSCEKGNVVLE